MARPFLSVRRQELRLNGRRLHDMQHIVLDIRPRTALDHGDPAIVELVSSGRAGNAVDAVMTGAIDPLDLACGDPLVYFALMGGCWPEGIGEG